MSETMDQCSKLRSLHEFAFCLNLGFAIALTTILTCLQRPIGFVHGQAQSPDLFRRMTIEINELLHRVPWDLLGTNVVLAAFTLLVCGVLLLVLKLVPRARGTRFILMLLAGISAVAAVPIAWTPYEPHSFSVVMSTSA